MPRRANAKAQGPFERAAPRISQHTIAFKVIAEVHRMNRTLFGLLGWVAGACLWAYIAWSYFSEGRNLAAAVQAFLCVLFLTRAIKGFIAYKKSTDE